MRTQAWHLMHTPTASMVSRSMLPMGQNRAQAPQREHLLQSVRGLALRNLAGVPSSFRGV